jgi:hypothetical protein
MWLHPEQTVAEVPPAGKISTLITTLVAYLTRIVQKAMREGLQM